MKEFIYLFFNFSFGNCEANKNLVCVWIPFILLKTENNKKVTIEALVIVHWSKCTIHEFIYLFFNFSFENCDSNKNLVYVWIPLILLKTKN